MILDSLPEPVQDAIYLAVGLPVVVVQELRTRQETLTSELDERLRPLRNRADEIGRRVSTPPALDDLNARIDMRLKDLETRVEEFETRFDELLDSWEAQLPDGARDVVHRTRDAAREARDQLRSLVTRAA